MNIQESILINAPAEHVWDILWNKYGQVCDWASTVNKSNTREVSGNANGGRTYHSAWGQISEIVEDVNEQQMTYSYFADGLPAMMKSAKNTWKVTEVGNQKCKVSIDLNVKLATVPKILIGWMMVPKMKKDIAQTLEDLKYFAETGKKTEAKKKADNKFFKKHPELVA